MKYYMHIDGQQLGPFEENDLLSHGLQRSTLVWCKTMSNWAPAYRVPALMQLLYPPVQKRAAGAQPVAAHAAPRPQQAPRAKRPAPQPKVMTAPRPKRSVPRPAAVWHRPATDTSLTYKQALTSALRHYFDFKGRARRSEYWKFLLIVLLANLVTAIIDWNLGLTFKHHGITGSIVSLLLLVPMVSSGVRRLHDMGQSGLKLLWVLLPVVGWVMVLNWHCQDSLKEKNRWGKSPKY